MEKECESSSLPLGDQLTEWKSKGRLTSAGTTQVFFVKLKEVLERTPPHQVHPHDYSWSGQKVEKVLDPENK